MTDRFIEVAPLLDFIRLLQSTDNAFSSDPDYSDREWALIQVTAYIMAKIDQPTIAEAAA